MHVYYFKFHDTLSEKLGLHSHDISISHDIQPGYSSGCVVIRSEILYILCMCKLVTLLSLHWILLFTDKAINKPMHVCFQHINEIYIMQYVCSCQYRETPGYEASDYLWYDSNLLARQTVGIISEKHNLIGRSRI